MFHSTLSASYSLVAGEDYEGIARDGGSHVSKVRMILLDYFTPPLPTHTHTHLPHLMLSKHRALL